MNRIAIPEKGKKQINYYNALSYLGAEPVMTDISIDVSEYDALLIPGGVDVNPARYGCENLGSKGINNELDELQFSTLDRFIKAGKPVLGICRGHQIIAAYFGISLIQDLPSKDIHAKKSSDPDIFHKVRSMEGSFIHKLYGDELVVNSSHHQAASSDGNGLKTAAISEDGVIEALYHESLPVISVQWHPERLCLKSGQDGISDGMEIFRKFMEMIN